MWRTLSNQANCCKSTNICLSFLTIPGPKPTTPTIIPILTLLSPAFLFVCMVLERLKCLLPVLLPAQISSHQTWWRPSESTPLPGTAAPCKRAWLAPLVKNTETAERWSRPRMATGFNHHVFQMSPFSVTTELQSAKKPLASASAEISLLPSSLLALPQAQTFHSRKEKGHLIPPEATSHNSLSLGTKHSHTFWNEVKPRLPQKQINF